MKSPDGWTSDTVHTDGIELQYYRTGYGPPLVLAHGFYNDSRCWTQLATDLADEYEIVLYDARGHGQSDGPETGYAIENRVSDLVDLVTALDLTDPILLGHSMGGSTVAWAAATYPDLPRAVVLEDPAGMYGDPEMGPDERATTVREQVRDWEDQSVTDIATDYTDREPKLARRLAVADSECSPHIAEIAREGYPDLAEAFPQITCPALVLKADADPEQRAVDLDIAADLHDGRLVHIPQSGHCVFYDRYGAAYAELRTFFHRIS
ncbi:alpha/beta fold hydrolase [Halorussus amylolyticus]|uniref:alpha/beta fold hydrolase n=1 Tax=Halorussus amylolyticus TaxID=1126242 RepID=UPI001042D9D9|nr:alpha/beta hydrolase [Halorussus amylolyticus]